MSIEFQNNLERVPYLVHFLYDVFRNVEKELLMIKFSVAALSALTHIYCTCLYIFTWWFILTLCVIFHSVRFGWAVMVKGWYLVELISKHNSIQKVIPMYEM